MTIKIKIKRSESANSVPTTSELEVGEICMNVADQKIYTRKSDDSIVTISETNTGKPSLELTSTDAGSTEGPTLNLYRNSFSPFDSDAIGNIRFYGENDNTNKIVYANIVSKINDATSSTEDGELELQVRNDGAVEQIATVKTDGLHIASGKALNFADGTSMTTKPGDEYGIALDGLLVKNPDGSSGGISIDGILTKAGANDAIGKIGKLLDDTSPMLGGNLDLNSNNISGTGTVTATSFHGDGSNLTNLPAGYNDADIKADILKLAICQAVDGNRIAFNLSDSFIDGFEDDTGIATETTVDRDVDDEYVASVIQSLVETPIAASDWGGGTSGYTLTTGGADQTSSNYSIYTTKTFSGDFTFQADNSWTGNTTGFVGIFDNNELGSFGSYPKDRGNLENMTVSYHADSWYPGSNGNQAYYGGSTQGSTYPSVANGETIKFERVGTTIKLYIGGNLRHTYASHPSSATFRGAIAGQDASTNMTNIKWTETQTTCNSSTGTLVSVTQTASSSRTSVSGVIVYEDEAGTATLGSDFKIYFTADNGSNWTEASSYGTPTTYTGTKKIVSLGNTTVTSGTQIAVKGVWANQSVGSKVTRLHGWAINY